MFFRLELEPQHPLQITRRTNRIYRAEAVQVCCRIGKISNYNGKIGINAKRLVSRGTVTGILELVVSISASKLLRRTKANKHPGTPEKTLDTTPQLPTLLHDPTKG
jgi:hypothetical protein